MGVQETTAWQLFPHVLLVAPEFFNKDSQLAPLDSPCSELSVSMPPTKSLVSNFSNDHPFAFSDQATVISKNSAWFQETVSPSDDLPEFSVQSSHDHSSKSGPVPPATHTFSLDSASASSTPLMTVDLHSWASSSTSLPTYVEGQSISGQVQLNLRTPDRVKAVSVSVEGYYSIPGYDAKTFLHLSETLWDSTMGDPRSSGMFLSQGADHSGKLHGKYSWSFKIDFPKTLEMTAKQEKRLGHGARSGVRLPPSLRGSHGQARIGYELVVRIKRPGLRFGNSLTIPVTYMVSTQPGPASLLRRLAYQNKTPVPSLIDDPSGWKVFPEFQVYGGFYRSQISFSCAFALASPLSYARGSFIPCALVISSSDQQVLEVISSPSAPRVLLERRLILRSKLGGEQALDGQNNVINKASWTPLRESARMQPGFRKVLQGEISIPPTAAPSFTFGRLELKYDVFILPFDAPGFTQSDNELLPRTKVTITTFLPEGPLPLSQSAFA